MTKLKTLFVSLVLSGCCGWSKTDTVLEINSQATLVGDWYTTDRALDTGKFYETNPVIREVGTTVYFPITMLLHLGISAALPPKLRTYFQGLTVGVQSKAIINNVNELRKM